MTSFYEYMMNYTTEDTPKGDLAKDMKGDCDFPTNASTFSEIRGHLESKDACRECIAAFKAAWKDYTISQKANA